MKNVKELKPFVKWVGGKSQLLAELSKHIPKKYRAYHEIFLGGGALFLKTQPSKAFVNDLNAELMTTWKVIKNLPEKLINSLDEIKKNHKSNNRNLHLNIRSIDKTIGLKNLSDVGIATRFIYLNKSSFNGMYRVNQAGFFNVPWNQSEKFPFYNKENILAISNYLNKNKITFKSLDYKKIIKNIKKNDFVFIDPPYDKLKNDTFTSYTGNGFGHKEQEDLAKHIAIIDKKGAKFILTNHNTTFINKLYKNYYKKVIKVRRAINSDGNKRTGEEIIISNIDLGVKND